MSRGDRAKELFLSGHSCSQSVVLAFIDCFDIPKESVMKIAAPFGGGFGRLREVCGAFSGMCIVFGYLCGYDEDDGSNKMQHYADVRKLAELFKAENCDSIICRDLIAGTENLSSENPSVRTDEYKRKRSCGDYVKNAVDILEKFLIEKGVKI